MISKPRFQVSFVLLGVILIVVFYIMIIENSENKKFLNLQRYKERTYKSFQSCARYFSPKLLHGKNKDGTANIGFCEDCYHDGRFTHPKLSAGDVIAEIKNHNPKEKDVDKKVNEMVRWNQNPYVDNYKF